MRACGPRILITGASGFIGCRLAEYLATDPRVQVRAMVHQWSGPGIARLGRLPVQMVHADLLDKASLNNAVRDCHIVVHCAFGNRGNAKQQATATVAGTRNLLEACVAGQIHKLIHLSTAVVHGRSEHGDQVDESSAYHCDGDTYSRSKIEVEKLVWSYQGQHNLPVVVFRPGIVYGPFGVWTHRILRDIQRGVWLVDEGAGVANIIYIDNLIHALLLAIFDPEISNQALIANDDETITWRDFYAMHADVLDDPPAPRVLTLQDWRQNQRRERFQQLLSVLASPATVSFRTAISCAQAPLLELKNELERRRVTPHLAEHLPNVLKQNLKKFLRLYHPAVASGQPVVACDATPTYPWPDQNLVRLQTCRVHFDNNKMKNLLGWKQHVSFQLAGRYIREWADYQRLTQIAA